MSGKGSRERRVRAVRRAREDVYANRGGPMGTIPFDCPRQAGIYSAAYEKEVGRYWVGESILKEMQKAYGFHE